jgi:hypothetical protein
MLPLIKLNLFGSTVQKTGSFSNKRGIEMVFKKRYSFSQKIFQLFKIPLFKNRYYNIF